VKESKLAEWHDLWDIETRINELQHELDHLHTRKAKLLGNKYEDVVEFTCT